ncbi:DNA-binding XRE family transcriptional regulator [Dysgonomonas hofstadii]|uniref:DNA-binding XRE family transcriptional regulator n=1 Tax=Dysgonomonas hofstadii TaxID=637886 RepID=A0A840CXF9_9BACT|nr:helix-turn-helix transcriptional regulator [Dysgonomonas hofstadii]MBB4037455.1 DNA-binding XRE family transcriptional regulator [Dysgonomonas hofstadii]
MLFSEKIKQLREERSMPQRLPAAELEIDTATYCKIERGDRRAKRNQVTTLSKIFKVNEEELVVLWLADQIMTLVENDKQVAAKALEIVKQNV